MRILCLIPALGAGGAERVMSYLVAHWAERHEVMLMTWEKPGSPSFFPIPASVLMAQADRLGGARLAWFWRVLSRPGAIRRAVKSFAPNVVVSFMDMMNVTALSGCVGLAVPVIVSERTDPSAGVGLARRVLRDAAYRLATIVVVQTQRVNGYFSPPLRSRIRVVANPVPPAGTVAEPDRPGPDGRFRVVSVGRLAPQKGHGDLIDAFARIVDRHPDWDLVIVGEGPDRAALDAKVRKLGLAGRVALPGVTVDVRGAFASAHLMGFPSLYEGFPNALAEGLAAGLPAVGYAGVSGVEELIVNGVTGLLTDPASREGALAEALSRLMADAPLRARMGQAGRHHVAQWSPERVFKAWDDVLTEAVAANRPSRQIR